MAISSKRGSFATEQEALDTQASLRALVLDKDYNTASSYSADSEHYPDHVMSFVDKHMHYLRTHSVELHHYLSNLRLMTRIR